MINYKLRAHQEDLVKQLTSPSSPRVLALVAPPWTGATTALAAAADAVVEQGGLVVIVTFLRTVADQWVFRFDAMGTTPVALIRGGSDLRLALSKGALPWPNHGVVVATDRGLGIGQISLKLDLNPHLLILDGADRMASVAIEPLTRLIGRSTVTVARARYGVPPWLVNDAVVEWSSSTVAPDRRNRYTLHRAPYEIKDNERALISRASTFLGSIGRPVAAESLNRYGVQRRLAELEVEEPQSLFDPTLGHKAFGLDGDQQEQLTDMLELFDDLELDPRLETLGRLVVAARAARQPCVIVLSALVEIPYVLGFLLDSLGGEIRELTSRTPQDHIRNVLDRLADGATVVVSVGMLENGEELPNGCWNIWWSVPRTAREADARLGVGFTNSGIEVHVPLPEPPLWRRPLAIEALIAEGNR